MLSTLYASTHTEFNDMTLKDNSHWYMYISDGQGQPQEAFLKRTKIIVAPKWMLISFMQPFPVQTILFSSTLTHMPSESMYEKVKHD